MPIPHGRKEQFSITLPYDTATIFWNYFDSNKFVYKNACFQNIIEKFQRCDEIETDLEVLIPKIISKTMLYMVGIVKSMSKSTKLKSALLSEFENIPKLVEIWKMEFVK